MEKQQHIIPQQIQILKADNTYLHVQNFDTPLGILKAAADDKGLYFLHYAEAKSKYVDRLIDNKNTFKTTFVAAENEILHHLFNALEMYFSGESFGFNIPLHLKQHKTFSQNVWCALRSIPYGETYSYKQQAELMGIGANYVRAIALANSQNPFSIILPCHRVIAANGKLSGYNGGIWRKKALLEHESRYKSFTLN